MFDLDELEITRRVQQDLHELIGVKSQPLFAEVSKWSKSMQQYEIGHLARIDQIEKLIHTLPGLTLAGNSYRGAGIPDCIKSGETAADQMLA